ncbi:uncharacterized protein LOC121928828 [Sceloporus undulatus]|uniref:uncharacterized protein LOC121928828 n=1 Tax=Sceloporus undulatus TaxID=8520 RepID=UPI001C4BADC2|nr:uncharacterized protein LOC121928828 [Sceloporus undulatus]
MATGASDALKESRFMAFSCPHFSPSEPQGTCAKEEEKEEVASQAFAVEVHPSLLDPPQMEEAPTEVKTEEEEGDQKYCLSFHLQWACGRRRSHGGASIWTFVLSLLPASRKNPWRRTSPIMSMNLPSYGIWKVIPGEWRMSVTPLLLQTDFWSHRGPALRRRTSLRGLAWRRFALCQIQKTGLWMMTSIERRMRNFALSPLWPEKKALHHLYKTFCHLDPSEAEKVADTLAQGHMELVLDHYLESPWEDPKRVLIHIINALWTRFLSNMTAMIQTFLDATHHGR